MLVLWYDCTMNLTEKQLNELKKCFKKEPLVKLVYLFGSQATGDIGPLSDYDFAMYADTKDIKKSYSIGNRLKSHIGRILKPRIVGVVMIFDYRQTMKMAGFIKSVLDPIFSVDELLANVRA